MDKNMIQEYHQRWTV